MMKLKELKPNNYYVIACRASANSVFFDNEKEIKLFENLFYKFLKGICKLKKVHYTSKGYVMLIKTFSKQSIKEAFERKKKQSSKRKESADSLDVWKMISEHFRYLGCSFVKIKNTRSGRVGRLFCRKYERFEISKEEIDQFELLLELGYVNLEQRKKEFRIKKNKVYRRAKEEEDKVLFKTEVVVENELVAKGYYLIL